MKIKGISKSYGDKLILSDFSAEFTNGITCIMGQSGCGKTTLLRIIAGLESIDAGSIENSIKPAMVFQEDRLIKHASVFDNLRIVSKSDDSGDSIYKTLDALELSDSAEQAVCELSGGMKRRVAVGRAFLSDKKLILMDEPFTGLDENTKNRVIEYIKGFKDRTVIVVTHDINDVDMLGAVHLITMK